MFAEMLYNSFSSMVTAHNDNTTQRATHQQKTRRGRVASRLVILPVASQPTDETPLSNSARQLPLHNPLCDASISSHCKAFRDLKLN